MINKLMLKKTFTFAVFMVSLLSMLSAWSVDVPITVFPLDKYSQNISDWIKPSDPDYNKPLLKFSDQKKQLKEYYKHYYATGAEALSPWGYAYVKKTLNQNLKDCISEQKIIKNYTDTANNPIKTTGYGENFSHYDEKWLQQIITNMNLKQFKLPISYHEYRRGIAIENLSARTLPTNDPYFFKFTKAGQGYPFDNLQDSALWVGTPVYIIGETLDSQWYLVLTPSYISWVKSNGIAKTSPDFITKWQRYAKRKMVAITKTNVSIFDTKNRYRFNAYTGAVFPGKKISRNTISILIPVNDFYYNAKIMSAKISNKKAAIMPLRATPHNFATIISSLLGRPYGWGNMYFYNDCSAELQSLYTPFGIWLPRNSSQQIKSLQITDMSSSTMEERLSYLQKNGKKFTTIVYIGGHIVMYIGTYSNPNSDTQEPMIMTYQNLWGLKPKDKSYRAVIGQSVFLPMLSTYPEDPELNSQANAEYFKIAYLDETTSK